MLNVRADVSELVRAAEAFRADVLAEELLRRVARVEGLAMAQARSAAPVFTGELANQILARPPQVEVTGGGSVRVSGTIELASAHGYVLEEGRRPGARRPPFGPIRRWVELLVRRGKLDVSRVEGARSTEEAIDVVAGAMVETIHRRGIAPRRFMEAAARYAEPILQAEVDQAAEEFRRRMER